MVKTRIFSLLLALSVLCTSGIPVLAAVGHRGFSDINPGTWYAEAADYVRESGLMAGTTATLFSPAAPASRATLATILYRRAGSPTARPADFPDVAAGAWYGSAAGWAAARGIVSGYGDGRFGPDDPVTREQLATLLWRAAGSPTAAGTSAFADQAAISPYALPAVTWAWEQGIAGGKSGNRFDPKGITTRAELAVMLCRWLGTGPVSDSGSDTISGSTPTPTPVQEENAVMPTLTIQVGNDTFSATLEDNSTTRAFAARLPMTVRMTELNGNEKFYYLPDKLPANSQRYETLHSGDLMLYGSDCLVLFYETFTSGYSYTRLGRVDDPAGLAAALGGGGIELTFEAY